MVDHAWHLPSPAAIGATAVFLCIDAFLVAGCASKIFDGGWFPLALGLSLFIVMETWEHGRRLVNAAIREEGISLPAFARDVDTPGLRRSDRTASMRPAEHSRPVSMATCRCCGVMHCWWFSYWKT